MYGATSKAPTQSLGHTEHGGGVAVFFFGGVRIPVWKVVPVSSKPKRRQVRCIWKMGGRDCGCKTEVAILNSRLNATEVNFLVCRVAATTPHSPTSSNPHNIHQHEEALRGQVCVGSIAATASMDSEASVRTQIDNNNGRPRLTIRIPQPSHERVVPDVRGHRTRPCTSRCS